MVGGASKEGKRCGTGWFTKPGGKEMCKTPENLWCMTAKVMWFVSKINEG